MKLSFYPKPGHVCHWPHAVRVTGQLYNYMGRTYNMATRVHEANKEPIVVDDEATDVDQRARAERAKEFCRRDDALWPADAETAAACNVAFVQVEMKDGEWQPKAAAAPVKPAKGKE